MFSNPIGQMFPKPDGEEKKKKRNKKSRKNISPDLSVESNSSLHSSKTDLTAEAAAASPSPAPEEAACAAPLLDIVNEINNQVPELVSEVTQVAYEELPVEESTMKAIIDSIHSQDNAKAPAVVEDCWEEMLSGPNEETTWESEVAAAPQAVDSVWEQMLSSPTPQEAVEEVEADASPEPQFEQSVEVEATQGSPEPEAEPASETEVTETAPVVESCWESMLSDPAEEPKIDSEKEKYMGEFNITGESYDLIKEFYEDQKDSKVFGLLKNDLLKSLLVNAAEQREELAGVTEEDVSRALRAVDSNNDDKVNFAEFVQLLALFCSSKNNLKQRINGVLNNMSASHENPGTMTKKEANGFTQFLSEFFGKHEETDEAKSSDNFLTKLVKKILKRKQKKSESQLDETETIDYAAFSVEATEELEDRCFVKFQ